MFWPCVIGMTPLIGKSTFVTYNGSALLLWGGDAVVANMQSRFGYGQKVSL